MSTLIKTDGTVTEVKPKVGKSFSYEELVEFIGGKPIDIVPLSIDNLMVVHDEGKLMGLPKNEKATEIWKEAYPTDQYPMNNDQLIVGDVLIGNNIEID